MAIHVNLSSKVVSELADSNGLAFVAAVAIIDEMERAVEKWRRSSCPYAVDLVNYRRLSDDHSWCFERRCELNWRESIFETRERRASVSVYSRRGSC